MARCARELLDTAPTLIRYIRQQMRSHRKGLSVPQFRALYKVRQQPATNLSVVAEHLSSSLPTASRIVTTLVAKGYLKRGDSSGDRRLMVLFITARGRAILDAADAATQAQTESLLAQLNTSDRDMVRNAMCILRPLLESSMSPALNGSSHVHSARTNGRGKMAPSSFTLAPQQRE